MGNSGEEFIDLILTDIEAFQYPHGALFHDILGTGTCGHAGYFSSDAFPHYWMTECPSCDCACMDFDYFMTGGMTDGGLAFDHEFAAHEYLCPVRVFVAVEQFARNNAAKFFYHIYIAVNRLLEYFIDHFKITGKVCTLEAAGQVNVDIEIGNEYDPTRVRFILTSGEDACTSGSSLLNDLSGP
jgi:hypothetical protein